MVKVFFYATKNNLPSVLDAVVTGKCLFTEVIMKLQIICVSGIILFLGILLYSAGHNENFMCFVSFSFFFLTATASYVSHNGEPRVTSIPLVSYFNKLFF